MKTENKKIISPINDAPEGVFKKVKIPHGEKEMCRVIKMNDFGGYVDFATVLSPVSLPYVRYSCFRV
jgi:hypothetical protein